MARLSSGQVAFIHMMTESAELEQRGFQLLLKRSDFAGFFDDLLAAGLFAPERNPGPVPAEQPGYFRVPLWHTLPYLEAVARWSDENSDMALAAKIMTVVRDNSEWRDAAGQQTDNYATWASFARILGLVPTTTVSMADIDLIPGWLKASFNSTVVGHALASGTLKRFAASGRSEDLEKACRIVSHCTNLEISDSDSPLSPSGADFRMVLDDYVVEQIVKQAIELLARKAPLHLADLFQDRLRRMFDIQFDGQSSWIFRPAIEDHTQNFSWRGAHNRFVEGLRDTLANWIAIAPRDAETYVAGLLASGSEITERIGIFLVGLYFDELRTLVFLAIQRSFFNPGHLHELYNLLRSHFAEFNADEQNETLSAIRAIPRPDRGDESERLLRYNQRLWLSAIVGAGNADADSWFNSLNADGSLGRLSEHPDFLSWHESRWGYGPTPISVEELIELAKGDDFIARINAFVPTNSWEGPSVRSLSDAVSEAVAKEPALFLRLLPRLLEAKPPYRYAVIEGFKKAWDSAVSAQLDGLDWTAAWPALMSLFELLLADTAIIDATDGADLGDGPGADWIAPLISDFIRAGLRDDNKAFAPDLLPRSLQLIRALLAKSTAMKEPEEADALTRAINSPKGKAIEALLEQALRSCRLADKGPARNHQAAWQDVAPLFDVELALCKNANFEFSAIVGGYIGNFEYLSSQWLAENFALLFPIQYPANCLSALEGLSYAQPTKSVYNLLSRTGVLLWALGQDLKSKQARERLLQRIALAYLWEQENLGSSHFQWLFGKKQIRDLEVISDFFWTVRGESLSAKQKAQILDFWELCVGLTEVPSGDFADLLQSLSLLTCLLDGIGEREFTLLLAVAPFAPRNYNADRFIDGLSPFAARYPREVAAVLLAMLRNYRPDYDFEDRLKSVIRELARHEVSQAESLLCLEKARHLPGFIELYEELSAHRG